MKWKELIVLRETNNLKQEDLAKKLNVSRPTISTWENGTRKPSIEDIIKISNLFGVSLEYLLSVKPQDMILITKQEYITLTKTIKALNQTLETIEKREGNSITFNVNDEGIVNYYEAQKNKVETK